VRSNEARLPPLRRFDCRTARSNARAECDDRLPGVRRTLCPALGDGLRLDFDHGTRFEYRPDERR